MFLPPSQIKKKEQFLFLSDMFPILICVEYIEIIGSESQIDYKCIEYKHKYHRSPL